MIVADASPVISLARIQRLGLLRDLYDEVLIPLSVEDEITRHPHGFGGPRPDWIRTGRAQDQTAVAEFTRRIHSGEAEAIVLSRELDAWLLIDEATGRKIAAAYGVQIIGTIGALLDAKRAGLLPQLEATLTELRQAGFRISEQLVADALRAAGEE